MQIIRVSHLLSCVVFLVVSGRPIVACVCRPLFEKCVPSCVPNRHYRLQLHSAAQAFSLCCGPPTPAGPGAPHAAPAPAPAEAGASDSSGVDAAATASGAADAAKVAAKAKAPQASKVAEKAPASASQPSPFEGSPFLFASLDYPFRCLEGRILCIC